jgi:hypothetical protein
MNDERTTLPEEATSDPVAEGRFTHTELTLALRRPHRIVDFVLGRPDRLARNLVEDAGIPLLALVLLVAGIVFAVPFGAVPPLGEFWKIAVLFTGSVLICYPCLHVFGSYLGFGLSAGQNLVVALLITGTAGIFSFGLAPIIWFIDLTTEADPGAAVTPAHIATIFLCVCLLMGIIQVGRCLFAIREAARLAPAFRQLLGLWLVLLVFITYRMARWLDLL